MMQRVTVLLPMITGLLGLGLILSPPARAQEEDFQVHEHGFQNGYRDGYQNGRESRVRSETLNYQTADYRQGERGYVASFGPIDEYRVAYRQGYREGVEDGYAGTQKRTERIVVTHEPERVTERTVTVYRDSGPDYERVASDLGYRDGLAMGLKDYRARHSYDPRDHDDYRDADRGYTSALGRKDDYKRAYRAAFEAGYREGFGLRRP